MIKQVLPVLVVAFCMYVVSVESTTCLMLEQLKTCFPNITRFMERPLNVSMVVLALGSSSRMPGIEARCLQFNALTDCVTNGLASCEQPLSDAGTPIVRNWENAKQGIRYMCNEHKQDFLDSQQCMSGNELRSDAAACNIAHDDHRRKRHSCSDYETEVLCADRAIIKHCGADVARRAGHIIRIFLKNSQMTSECKAPAFSSAEGVRSVSTVLAFSVTSFVVAMLTML